MPAAGNALHRLARGGAVASVIKLASAGLSFLLFVVVALVTDQREFGLFSTTYAGASLVSFFASVGQQATVLRFWPQYAGNGAPATANSLMARSILVTLGGLVVSSLGLVALGFLPWFAESTPEWLPLCLGAALLSFALGWSEFAAGAFRAKSVLVGALLPRDVIWRLAVIAVVCGAFVLHATLDAVTATLLAAGLLLASTAPQAVTLIRDTLRQPRTPLRPHEIAEFNRVTTGLWGVTALPPALAQVSTLLVAGLLGPEAAGALFVADRATRLVLLALLGINQALAPEISSAFYGGDKLQVQKVTSAAALGSSVIALFMLVLFLFMGRPILWIFDAHYATAETHIVLMILAVGATFATLCGPIEVLLQLTGLQHSLLKLLIVVNSIGLAATTLLTWRFGSIGAALGIAATLMTWNGIAAGVARRRIGIDPTVLGLLRLRRPRNGGRR
jgi:O-antigen/teichoic acid export membrane protein